MEIEHIFDDFFKTFEKSSLKKIFPPLQKSLNNFFDTSRHGDRAKQLRILHALKEFPAQAWHEAGNAVCAGAHSARHDELKGLLMGLRPWRKGPWNFCGLPVESEWDSSLKWARCADVLDLKDRRVLDIGSGNGYYCQRMLAAGARCAVGIDPGSIAVLQHMAFRLLSGDQPPAWVLPLKVEDLPGQLPFFDTVFSMGVLYHRRSPVDHLRHIKGLLKPGGEAVIETIVVDESWGEVLIPEDRYACMPNVWFIPSVSLLHKWLRRLRFTDIETLDVSPTDTREQRRTEWIHSQSLEDFLTSDRRRTLEGYPPPRRALVRARRR
ncbi:MAG: tRNA 5-methoxyuridine(34)/uridine 5-oxyacetic acid(34) synthase CmoB [Fibrobacterota bacterium]